jgi:transposase
LSGAAGVIALPTGTQVWLAAGVTDMRRGMHGLAATVQMVLLENPHSGHVFVFRGRRRNQTTFCIPFAICRC